MIALLDGAITVAAQSQKPKPAPLVKKLTKNSEDKIQEEHSQWAT